jgi:predicted GH43/DUF377 family glycosyl hydrolase
MIAILRNKDHNSLFPGNRLSGSCLVFAVVVAILVLHSTGTFAQTQWFKYDGNPVLTKGQPGSWDDVFILEPWLIFDGTTYKMWYTGSDGTNRRIGYATSADGVNWTKIDSINPVLDVGQAGNWDDHRVEHPSVMFDGTTYKMWYTGHDGTNSRIGYAWSSDGMNWTKVDTVNPVLDLGSFGSWDAMHVLTPVVIFTDSTHLMWYTGADGSTRRIGLARSLDGMHWTKDNANPVIDVSPSGWDSREIFPESVLYDGTNFQMWYAGGDQNFIYRTGYATSPDGVHWQKDSLNPVLDVGPPGAWDDAAAAVGSVLLNGSGYRMWYDSWAGSSGAIGFAATDSSVFPTSVENDPKNIPEQFMLFQNYPNPFNPSTTIEFALAKPGWVTLKVYNILGQEVATLVSEKLSAGSYKYNLDARGLASGVYYYRIETDHRFTQTKKMLLIR